MTIVNLYESYLLSRDSSELGRAFARLKAGCLEHIIETAKGETRDALQANKYLLEFNPTEENKRGRPTKADVLSEAKKMAEESSRLEEDYKRVFGDTDAIQED